MNKKTIVVSAVNLNVGGTLTILRDCLSYLSQLAEDKNYRVVALVYDSKLVTYPNIEYIETRWPKKSWLNRLWYEYFSMKKISKKLGHADLWLSLHDTTPNVLAKKQAVYCHNPFPFYDWKFREWIFAPKIVLFSLFSKLIYKKNIYKNNYVIVQQQWIKDEFRRMFNLASNKIIVAVPNTHQSFKIANNESKKKTFSFMYASSANSHKNFECLCEASSILEQQGITNFIVNITLTGNENAYSKWLFKKWGNRVHSLRWIGFLERIKLFELYEQSNCLIFPSKVETWGLPISEFAAFDKPMLLADLHYAYETAQGSKKTAFFNPNNPRELATLMKKLIQGDASFLSQVPITKLENPYANSWKDLFNILLS